MSSRNITYKTDRIAEFYACHRNKWNDFYASERWIFERIAGSKRDLGRVLDVGCAVGGLAQALSERFHIEDYVGVDINTKAIESAKMREVASPSGFCRFECGDILDMKNLESEMFDNVFSLSCADWNVLTKNIVQECWRYVNQGGYFILTLRLTTEDSLYDISKSFQYICFGEEADNCSEEVEKAPYVVINVREALGMLSGLEPKPAEIVAFGYWGQPSPSARTLYKSLCFAALAVKKGHHEEQGAETVSELHLPVELMI